MWKEQFESLRTMSFKHGIALVYMCIIFIPYGGPEVSQHNSNYQTHFNVHNTFQKRKHNSIIIQNTFQYSQHISKFETQSDNCPQHISIFKTHFNIHNTNR